MTKRLLSSAEEAEARKVFGSELPYGKIYISDITGAGGAPFTVAYVAPGFPPEWHYVLNMGTVGYLSCVSSSGIQETLIHELTHVWQGHHSMLPSSFMVNSLVHQGMSIVRTGSRSGAYSYVPGSPWNTYGAEQQAQLVEDWYAGGMSSSDPRFTYITSNIRAGRP